MPPSPTLIHSIGTAVPRYRADQERVARFMAQVACSQIDRAHATSVAPIQPAVRPPPQPAVRPPPQPDVQPDVQIERRRACAALARVSRRSAIQHRHSVLADYLCGPEDFTFYPRNWGLEPFPSTAERMKVYRREAPPLARAAIEACLGRAPHVPRRAISHFIVVSCTGFFAPGLDVLLMKELGLRPDVQRQVIGFMGCYAAFNGLRAAHAICRAEPDAVVLLVCVELCSLHFQRTPTMDNIVANTLFADGAAAVLLAGSQAGADHRKSGAPATGRLALLGSHTLVTEEDSLSQMTWDVTDTGFQMRLSVDIPDVLRGQIAPFVDTLLVRHGLDRQDIDFWAIHPGGRRIVDALRERLALPEAATAASFEVLAEYGNMSSPTVLFVLDRCLGKGLRQGARGVAMAFGPGLTLESMLFQVAGGDSERR